MSPGSAIVWETRKASAWNPEDLGRVDLLEGARTRRYISKGSYSTSQSDDRPAGKLLIYTGRWGSGILTAGTA